MARILNPSDIFLIRSDRHAKCVVCGAAQTSPPARAWPAPNRANSARFTDRDLQALRSAELPLHRRTWARPQAISAQNQTNRKTPAAWFGDLQDIVRAVKAKGASLKATEQPTST